MILPSIRKIVAARRLKYDEHITFIYKQLEELCVLPASDVWVYIDGVEEWHAVVGGRNYRDDNNGFDDGVYVFRISPGNVDVEIQPLRGFRPNGSLIYS